MNNVQQGSSWTEQCDSLIEIKIFKLHELLGFGLTARQSETRDYIAKITLVSILFIIMQYQN